MRSALALRSGAGATLLLALGACSGERTPGETVRVTIPQGASLATVVDTLEARGVISAATLFRTYARARGASRVIKAGQYDLNPSDRWKHILEDLTTGRVVTEELTIPEGFTLQQMVAPIALITRLPEDSVAARLLSSEETRTWPTPGPSLEGYLFPDTYRFAPGVSVDLVVREMLDRYQEIWTEERRQARSAAELSEREVMTLASIVQAEAAQLEEMPVIASVYLNRLAVGMPLQADPTVIYALGGPRERLLFAAIDSVADSPYNTYQHAGLPPGPIAAPGEAAIDAVLHPEESDFLYFVARPGGTHIFTRTLVEHNKAVARARRERAARRAPGG